MKLELGKTYRTRGGKVLKIDCVVPNAAYPFKSPVGDLITYSWLEDGAYVSPGIEHKDDLIEEVTVSTNLTLKPGKYYRTRDGRKAYVAGVSPFDVHADFQVAGWIYGVTTTQGWCLDGRHIGPYYDSQSDLISEWRDPIKVSGWLNVYRNLGPYLFDTKELADAYTGGERIACIYVSGIEGEEPLISYLHPL